MKGCSSWHLKQVCGNEQSLAEHWPSLKFQQGPFPSRLGALVLDDDDCSWVGFLAFSRGQLVVSCFKEPQLVQANDFRARPVKHWLYSAESTRDHCRLPVAAALWRYVAS